MRSSSSSWSAAWTHLWRTRAHKPWWGAAVLCLTPASVPVSLSHPHLFFCLFLQNLTWVYGLSDVPSNSVNLSGDDNADLRIAYVAAHTAVVYDKHAGTQKLLQVWQAVQQADGQPAPPSHAPNPTAPLPAAAAACRATAMPSPVCKPRQIGPP